MNIIDFNHCLKSTCNCGWNITLGSKSEVKLANLRKFLKENNLINQDLTNYSEKISTDRF